MSITKTEAKALTDELTEAINAVLAKHGMAMSNPRTGYGFAYSLKFDATTVTLVNGVNVDTADAVLLKAHAELLGLPADCVGRSFTANGKTYTVAGYRPKARTRPILVRGDDGKDYVFPLTAVINGLAIAARGAA